MEIPILDFTFIEEKRIPSKTKSLSGFRSYGGHHRIKPNQSSELTSRTEDMEKRQLLHQGKVEIRLGTAQSIRR